MDQAATERQAHYLDINELADQLRVSVATLYRWRSDGTDMPLGFAIGSRIRWRQQTVDLWIQAQEAKAAS